MSTVRTRFAPSPTGYMHIGGMRTALFNWLWARHNGGQFVLRIDDTDRKRNIDEALQPILEAFRWLQLDWDEGPEVGGPYGPYFQSERTELYRQAAERLLAEGKAFRDFDSPEQVRADREEAEKQKRPYLNVRRSLDLSPEEQTRLLEQGTPFVVRLLVPRDQTVAIDDAVRGHVQWDCSLIPDPVILRSDGSALYNLATVVDDAAMRITHVLRAEEHLSNTPVQVLLHQALGNPLPTFAHIPYVAAPGSKEKLSKRKAHLEKYRHHASFRRLFEMADRILPRIGIDDPERVNPVMVAFYEAVGFLPEAVFNALARLGWSLDDRTEIMSRPTVVENFSLERIVKSPAGLDPDKLLSFQAYWMGERSLEEKIDGCLPFLQRAGLLALGAARSDADPAGSSPPADALQTTATDLTIDEATRQYVGRVIEVLGERLVVYGDILQFDEFFVADEALKYDEKAFEKRIRKPENAVELLTSFREVLAEVEPFDAETIERRMREFCAARDVKLGAIIHAVRVAVTGKASGPGLFEALELLGRRRCLRRIDLALERV